MQRSLILLCFLIASVRSVCESDDCPIAEWKYDGKLQHGCANPSEYKGGFWCASKVDEDQNYIDWKKCKCKEPPGCHSEQCPIKSWKYMGEELLACSDPYGYSGGSWCPTAKSSLDENGNWQGGSWTKCQCGAKKEVCDGTGENSGDCCTDGFPCKAGEGDCDSDSDCVGDLICGSNNCKGEAFAADDDCCYDRKKEVCDGTAENIAIGSCCTKDFPCKAGEGDCDSDR